jgi:hypothetical protein
LVLGTGAGTLQGAVAGTGGRPVSGQIPDCASTDGLATIAAANNAAPISPFSRCFILERIISNSSDMASASAVPPP